MYLGIDLGTSSIKVGIVGATGNLCWVGEETLEPVMFGDRAEINAESWWIACQAVIRRAPQHLAVDVKAIGLSGQMHGLVLVDGNNRPICDAILWPDRRAGEYLEPFMALEAARPGTLANPIVPGMPGPVLLWLRENEYEVWSSASRVFSPKDWLRSRLTDEEVVVTDPSDASATLMYDVRLDDWSPAVKTLLGIDDSMLPQIVDSNTVAGLLSPAVGLDLGLRPNVPVATGASDTAAALLGLGVREPGTVVLNIGTGGQALAIIDGPPVGVTGGLHQYRTANPGSSWYVMAAVLNAGLALGWVRTVLGLGWVELFSHAEEALTRACDDPMFVPFLVGERDPDVGLDSRGAWLGLAASHDQAALARGALVGIASYLARRTRFLLDLTEGTRVILAGGSARNLGWVQLMANLTGRTMDLAIDEHASVRGAAAIAAESQGNVIPQASLSGQVEPMPSQIKAVGSCLNRLDQLIADPGPRMISVEKPTDVFP